MSMTGRFKGDGPPEWLILALLAVLGFMMLYAECVPEGVFEP